MSCFLCGVAKGQALHAASQQTLLYSRRVASHCLALHLLCVSVRQVMQLSRSQLRRWGARSGDVNLRTSRSGETALQNHVPFAWQD